MKTKLTILSLVVTAFVTLALTNFEAQEKTPGTHATVVFRSSSQVIVVYYGSGMDKQETAIKKGETAQDIILDKLNDLSAKGYEIVSTTSHSVGAGNSIYLEFYYTLRKR